MHLILGSASPRRKEIFSFFSLSFTVATSHFDEDTIPFDGDPKSYAAALATEKGKTLLPLFPQAAIVTADTVVFYKEKIYGKPRSIEEAQSFLTALSGQWHSVFTALTLFHQGSFIKAIVEETKVLFNQIDSRQIDSYLSAIKWQDKAAGYAIQGSGGLLVQKIEGCYYNVMGMPINALAEILKNIGIDLWRCL